MSNIELITPEWPAPARVRAAFTLRRGGVSTGAYASLNLATHVGDDPAAVAENRRRLRAKLSLRSEPVWLEQVHGIAVADLDAPPSQSQCDAAITRTVNRVCAIQVADCMPVLFASRDGLRVGAAHAGWRGLAGGVLESTVAALQCEPARLLAWLGPCISAAHFEVGDEVRAAFVSADARTAAAFERNARGRWQCDLYAIARRRLSVLGIGEVHGGGWCTYAQRNRFFSYRRDGQCGRMSALIWCQSDADRARDTILRAARRKTEQVEELEHA